MPKEIAKPQLSRDFDLGLDNSLTQGKSFTRSVSISEPTASTFQTLPRTSISFARSISGGETFTSTGTTVSPSPLSSSSVTTTTLSPDSPVATSSALFAPNPTYSPPAANNSVARTINTMETAVELADDPISPLRPSSLPQFPATEETITEVDLLLRNAQTRKTFYLLCSVMEDRLPKDWRAPLVRRQSYFKSVTALCRPEATAGQLDMSASETEPKTQSNGARRSASAVLTPDEVCVVKRSRLQMSQPPDAPDGAVCTSDLCQSSRSSSSPVDVVSLQLCQTARRLVNLFESRYGNKLGNLVDDVAHLGSDAVTASESAGDTSCSTAEAEDLSSPPSLEDAKAQFYAVLQELFSERVNWGRIVGMFAFLRARCEVAEQKAASLKLHANVRPYITVRAQCQSASMIEVPPGSFGTTLAQAQLATTPLSTDTKSEPNAPIQSTPDEGFLSAAKSTPTQAAISPTFLPRAAHYLSWATSFIHNYPELSKWIDQNGGWDGLIEFAAERDLGGLDDVGNAPQVIEDEVVSQLHRAVAGVAAVAVGTLGVMAALRFLTNRL